MAFAISSMLPDPVPDIAELSAITLLSQFSPELADVPASLQQTLIKIGSIGVDRVWVATRRPLRKHASLYPSLHRAKTDPELASSVGLAHTTIDQHFHLFIESVSALAIPLFCCWGRSGHNLICRKRLSQINRLAGCGRLRHDAAMGFESGSQCLSQVAQQMPAIGDLNGFWSSSPCGICVSAGPVATDDLRSRMLSQPCRCLVPGLDGLD